MSKYLDIEVGIEVEQKFNNQYLTLPMIVSLKKSVIGQFYALSFLGGYGSYWMHSSVTGGANVFNSSTNSENNTLFNLRRLKVHISSA